MKARTQWFRVRELGNATSRFPSRDCWISGSVAARGARAASGARATRRVLARIRLERPRSAAAYRLLERPGATYPNPVRAKMKIESAITFDSGEREYNKA